MKISKKQLQQLISEEFQNLQEEDIMQRAAGTASEFTQSARSSETAKEIAALTPRERKVLGVLRDMQTQLASPGEQVTANVLTILRRLIAELERNLEKEKEA